MDYDVAEKAFRAFMGNKEAKIGTALSMVPNTSKRLSQGWAFYYQSKAYVETGDWHQSLVGHGPVVLRDDGKIIEGGSLDHDPEALLTR